MKTRIRLIPVLLLAAFIALAMPHKAEAINLLGWTDSGTAIVNRADINFQVGGVSQTLIESSPLGNTTPGAANGADTTFVVDNRVLVTVVAVDGTTVTTYPGSAAQALEFTVTNSGNTPQDYDLTTGLDVDNMFVATVSVDVYVDTNASGVYDAGDTLTTTLDEMAIDETRTVFVVANAVPLSAVNGDWANYYLRAITHDAGGAGLGALTANDNLVADTPGTVDVVFDDIDGDAAAIDGLQDGAEMAWGADNVPAGPGGPGGFVVAGALLTVTKTSAVISDPINLLVNPKAIPGATVEYTITIDNAVGAATATSVAIADTIDANTTALTAAYGAGMGLTINFNGGGAVNHTSAADGVEGSGYTASFVGGVISVGQITVAATQNVVIKYQVTIN